MDMVKEAGFDETFVDDWDTFVDCVTAMTKGTDTYGLGIGMQLGGFGEWYQRARAAGGSYLDADLSAPAINTPEVVAGDAAAGRLLLSRGSRRRRAPSTTTRRRTPSSPAGWRSTPPT